MDSICEILSKEQGLFLASFAACFYRWNLGIYPYGKVGGCTFHD